MLCFVGDFQQLQPITGVPSLRDALEREVTATTLRRIDLRQVFRSTDPDLDNFLWHARSRQPSRRTLRGFLAAGVLPSDANVAVRSILTWERRTTRSCTILTVMHRGAAM